MTCDIVICPTVLNTNNFYFIAQDAFLSVEVPNTLIPSETLGFCNQGMSLSFKFDGQKITSDFDDCNSSTEYFAIACKGQILSVFSTA